MYANAGQISIALTYSQSGWSGSNFIGGQLEYEPAVDRSLTQILWRGRYGYALSSDDLADQILSKLGDLFFGMG